MKRKLPFSAWRIFTLGADQWRFHPCMVIAVKDCRATIEYKWAEGNPPMRVVDVSSDQLASTKGKALAKIEDILTALSTSEESRPAQPNCAVGQTPQGKTDSSAANPQPKPATATTP